MKRTTKTNTGVEIVKKFSNKKINPKEVPGVLVKGHGVFSWGEKYEDAFRNAFIMEQIAEMYYYSISLNNDITLPDYILNKHYERKHGVNAYYGQR